MKLKLLCLLLLLTSCAHPPSVRFSELTITCPSGSAYSTKDKLCHFKPVMVSRINSKPQNRPNKKLSNKAKAIPLNCQEVFNLVNNCMIGN